MATIVWKKGRGGRKKKGNFTVVRNNSAKTTIHYSRSLNTVGKSPCINNVVKSNKQIKAKRIWKRQRLGMEGCVLLEI